jgi:hypothetical protein
LNITVLFILRILAEPFSSFYVVSYIRRGTIAKSLWAIRFSILFGFVTFDLLSTRYFITALAEEGNSYARFLMQEFGISTGLVLFSMAIAGILALVLYLSKIVVANRKGTAGLIIALILDLGFGWFVAGMHFIGGTSWFWLAPEIVRGLMGAGLYLVMLYSILLVIKGGN